MNNLLDKINRLKAEYEALLPISDESRNRLDKKFRLEFNYNSNHMEGNTLTYGETELLLIFGNTKGDHTLREYEEMKAHDAAYRLIQEWAADPRPLSESDIKNLNKILLVRPYWKDAITPDGQATRREIKVGEYKQYPNSVRLPNGEIFKYASPDETPILMGDLLRWYNAEEEKAESHPLLLAALLHYRLVRIHPFDDGNGRVSRLVMNYVLLKHGFPVVVIKSAEKDKYLRALNMADAGDTESFVRYIGEQLLWSLELAVKAAKGEKLDEPDDLDKELVVLQKQLAGKTTLQKKASPDVTAYVFEHSLVPMFQMIEEKLEKLKSSFFDVERLILINTMVIDPELSIGSLDRPWQLIISDFWNKQPRKVESTLQGLIETSISFSLYYTYTLKGLRAAKETPDFSVRLEVFFNTYNYLIEKQVFSYDEQLTPDQMRELITPPIRNIIEQIKEITKS